MGDISCVEDVIKGLSEAVMDVFGKEGGRDVARVTVG
jgi:hypothetical protein